MTPQEHKLMMTMFARQSQMLEILTTVLKREEILKGDDIRAFSEVVILNDDLSKEIALSVAEEYRRAAKAFGVVVDEAGS
jgi:hypothetical protein